MQPDTVLLRCTACRTLNRVPSGELRSRPFCGKCRSLLTFPEAPVSSTAGSFDRDVSDWPMVLLVEFYANWCGHCRAVEPAVQDIAAKHAGFVKVLKVDVDSQPGLASRFSIKGTPGFLLYKKGRLLGRLAGAPQTHSDLQAWVLQALKG